MKILSLLLLLISLNILACQESEVQKIKPFARAAEHLISEKGIVFEIYFPETIENSDLTGIGFSVENQFGVGLELRSQTKYKNYKTISFALQKELVSKAEFTTFYRERSEKNTISLCSSQFSYRLTELLNNQVPK